MNNNINIYFFTSKNPSGGDGGEEIGEEDGEEDTNDIAGRLVLGAKKKNKNKKQKQKNQTPKY